MGFNVEAIPETNEKRADLLASDAEARYIIEIKHKFEDQSLAREDAARMARGEVVTRSESTGHRKRIIAILKHGRKQLDATPAARDAFRLLWFFTDGADHDLLQDQAYSTFYGRVYLVPKEPPESEDKECFYFDYSAACSMPSVDGMILANNSGLLLCLNEHSERYADFRETSLCQQFAAEKAVIDPVVLRANGKILACTSTGPRKDDNELLDELRTQTGILYIPIRFVQASASVMVSLKADSRD